MRPFRCVMCMVCGEVIPGNPSSFGIVRLCDGKLPNGDRCKATAVMPTRTGAQVRWDKALYAAVGEKEPLVEWLKEGTTLPNTSRAAVEDTTLDSIVEQHLNTLAQGGEI
jgi:hypothetical protein